VEVHEDAVESAVKIKRNEANGDVGFDFDSLWGEDEVAQTQHHIPERPEWAKRDKLAFEREMLGLYVSDHPLAGLELQLAKLASTGIAELVSSENIQDGETVTIAGLVTSVQHRVAKASGNQYGMIQVEDFGGELTVMFMGKAYQEYSHALKGDTIVVVRGRVSLRDDGMNLHAFSLMTPDLGQADDAGGTLMITMPDQRATTDTVSSLAEVLARHPGEAEVRLRLVKGPVARVFEVPKPVKVSPDLYGELKALLGPNCLV
jgi:DNA polymerase-3 subunit alpha